MRIKEVKAKIILDSRNEKTIQVEVKTDYGIFVTSSPSGKSTGKNETLPYKISVEEDAKQILDLSEKIENIDFNRFADLLKVEEKVSGFIGANTLYALETSLLKALALEQEKTLWQLINPNAKKIPTPVGNCIGGGMHTKSFNGKPDIQEFHVIPREQKFFDNAFLLKKSWEIAGSILRAKNAKNGMNDENAWNTNLKNEDVLDVMKSVRMELEDQGQRVDIGVDFASSSFFNKRLGLYEYKNPYKRIKESEQKIYVENLIKDYSLFYVEDPMHEESFSGFSALRNDLLRTKGCLVVGDDLICSKVDRLRTAIENNSINAVIVKPNQVGSLIEIARLVNLAKKNNIITVMSHRSGETIDYSLADLSFAFQTEFIKTGITGKEREVKLSRLIEIEKSLNL